MDVFELQIPERGLSPLMVEAPHAGLAIPPELANEISVTDREIRRDADIFVDELYARAPTFGAAYLAAKCSRYVVDLNRAADDVDLTTVPDHPAPRGAQPRGVIWRMTTDGRPVLEKPLTYARLRERLVRYHAPYHDALKNTLDLLRDRFGYVVLIAAHSMPSVGRAGHTDPGTRRADIVPGTLGRTSSDPRVIDLVDAHFRAAGLSVRHDDPYKGGYTTQHYGRPREHVHVVQIEINRAVYVNEDTGIRKAGDFERLQTLLDELVQKMAKIRL